LTADADAGEGVPRQDRHEPRLDGEDEVPDRTADRERQHERLHPRQLVAAPREEERPGERARAERAAHEPERDNAVEDAVGVDGLQDAGHARIEHVRDDDHAHDRSHELVVPEVREALTQVGDVSARADCAARPGRALDEQPHEQGRDGKGRGVEEQQIGGIEHRDQHSGKWRSDHARAARDAVEQAGAALDVVPARSTSCGRMASRAV
jgi:hypothetical protein